MAGVLENFDRSSRLLFVFKSVGDIFIKMLGLASVIEKFVWGESELEEVEKKIVWATRPSAAASCRKHKTFFTFILHC